jgi:hypothetical protein
MPTVPMCRHVRFRHVDGVAVGMGWDCARIGHYELVLWSQAGRISNQGDRVGVFRGRRGLLVVS